MQKFVDCVWPYPFAEDAPPDPMTEQQVKALARAMAEDRWGQMGIPPRLWPATIDQCPQVEKLAALPCDLLLTGPNGVGKSYAAAALAKSWGARWTYAPDILIAVRSCYEGGGERQFLEELCRAPALVIDDLWAINRTENGIATILYLISKRLDNGRPTIVTMDRTRATIHRDGDTSLASRLGAYREVQLKGKDRRLDHGAR